jgi:predicted molibdopterin-dependent oxidoreductase YjgC
MFTRTRPGALTILFDGVTVPAQAGESAASALIAAGILVTRHTPVSTAPRGPFCMMGACFDCLAVVDGRGGVQLCLTPVRDGMRIETQRGARALDTRSP